MNRIFSIIIAVCLFAASLSAQQVNIFGKVRDTSGAPLEGAIVLLAAHPSMADTTGKDGLFSIKELISGIRTPLALAGNIKPFTKGVGNTVCFAVNEPTAITIEIFNTRGQQLAQLLNGIVAAGTYQIPVTTDFGKQILIVRVRRGNDVQAISMQNMNASRKSKTNGFSNASSASAKALASLQKTNAGPAIDTLVCSRRGCISQRIPLTTYTTVDSINITLQVITDPFLICSALNLAPYDTSFAPHFRDDSTYRLSVIATNTGGGNAYSSAVYVSSSDTDVVISSSSGSLSNVQAGLTKTSSSIGFTIKKRLAPGRKIKMNFRFVDSWSGTTREWFDTLYWSPKPLRFEGSVLDDDNIAPTSGNGNGKVEPYETIGIAPVVKNMSDVPITTMTGRILSTYAGLDTLAKNSFFPWTNGLLSPGRDGTVDSEFVSSISSAMKFVYGVAPLVKDSVRYDVMISGTYAGGSCQWMLPVYCAAKVIDTARYLTVNRVLCNVSITPNNTYYLTGDTVRLSATPYYTGYHFVNWTGDTNTNAPSIKLTMNKSKTVTATCTIDSFPLTIIATNGTVTKNPDKFKYAYGDSVTLTAFPATGWGFVSWYQRGTSFSSSNPVKLALKSDSAITAYFIPLCTLTVNSANGTVTKNPDKPQYVYGDTVTLTAVPAADYRFLNWSGALTGNNNPAKLVMTGNLTVGVVTEPSTVIDIDGNVYHTVRIGTQVWTVENLKTTRYNDGTAIPLVTDSTAWTALTTPGYCWNGNVASNANPYGALYNWYTVNTGKLAPAGWHVPTDAEWTKLSTYLGGDNVSGGKLKEAGTKYWPSPNTGATNETGFSALPGGRRSGDDGSFFYMSTYGYWWSATQDYQYVSSAYSRVLNFASGILYNDYDHGNCGLSVRLVRVSN